jgi:hypothetical protein
MAIQAVAVVDLHHPTSRRKSYSAVLLLVFVVSVGVLSRIHGRSETKLGHDRSVGLTALQNSDDIHRRLQQLQSPSYSQQEERPKQEESLQGHAMQQPNSMQTRPPLEGQIQSIQQEPSKLDGGHVRRSQQGLSRQSRSEQIASPIGGKRLLSVDQQEELREQGAFQQEIQHFSSLQGSSQHPRVSHQQSQGSRQSFLEENEQLRTLGTKSKRPIMYTYYQQAVTDMTEDADADLIENWKKAWYDAGWQPIVLNESDARKLPEFDALVELVVDPKHIGTYNMACE